MKPRSRESTLQVNPGQKLDPGCKRLYSRDSENDLSATRGAKRRREESPSVKDIQHWTIGGEWSPNMQRSQPSLKRSNSSSSSETASDRRPRERKSSPYSRPLYESKLERHGSFMKPSKDIPTAKIQLQFKTLLEPRTDTPKDTLFDDKIFRVSMDDLHNRNEAKVIQDLARVIVPSAEQLARQEKISISVIESVNEGWDCAMPIEGPRPQPDYSVGFKLAAFSEQQQEKLTARIGTENERSLYRAAFHTLFPFLTCEVKCGQGALDIADRQNAHSMTLAVRGVLALFRAEDCVEKLNGKVLAFSVSHDDQYIRIYGHYAVTKGDKTTFHRETIRNFCFTDQAGAEKWTSYNFIRNVYEQWLPQHHKRICEAIDQLPTVPTLPSPSTSHQSLTWNPQPSGLSRAEMVEESEPDGSISSSESQKKKARSDVS